MQATAIITKHSQLPSTKRAKPVSFMNFTILSPRDISSALAVNGVMNSPRKAAIPKRYFFICFIANKFYSEIMPNQSVCHPVQQPVPELHEWL